VEYALNKVGCRALIVSPQFKSSDYLEMLYDLAPEWKNATPGQLKAQRLPNLEIVIRLGEGQSRGLLNFASLLAEPTAEERAALREQAACCNLMIQSISSLRPVPLASLKAPRYRTTIF